MLFCFSQQKSEKGEDQDPVTSDIPDGGIVKKECEGEKEKEGEGKEETEAEGEKEMEGEGEKETEGEGEEKEGEKEDSDDSGNDQSERKGSYDVADGPSKEQSEVVSVKHCIPYFLCCTSKSCCTFQWMGPNKRPSK